jgi:hypothetical protein
MFPMRQLPHFILQLLRGASVQHSNQQQKVDTPDSGNAVMSVMYTQHSSPYSNLESSDGQDSSKCEPVLLSEIKTLKVPRK